MKKIYYILTVIYLVSCTSNTIYEKPKDLIPKDTMVNLLTDLYLASSATSVKNKNLELKVKYIPIIYNKYKIDSSRFKTSNTYYLSKIDEYGKLFVKVKDSLIKLQNFYKKKEDSIRNVERINVKKSDLYIKTDSIKRSLKKLSSLKNRDKSLVKKK